MGGFNFTIPRGVRFGSELNIPGVTVYDYFGGQKGQIAPDASPESMTSLTQAVSQAVNENIGAQAQRMYRDNIDATAVDPAEIQRRKNDSLLPTAIGLLAAAAMPYAAPALGSFLGGVTGIGGLTAAGGGASLLGSTVGGGLLGGATAAATGDSIVEGVLTGGLSGGLAGVDVGQILPAASRNRHRR